MSHASPLVAGVDGCPAGWIAAVGSIAGNDIWLTFEPTFERLVHQHPRVMQWAVDIPIGLADEGPRECDRLARKRLGPGRGSSVFPSPPRVVSHYVSQGGNDYAEACRIAAEATGKKISKQAWNITPKIAEVRGFLIKTPRYRRRVFETHPELGFAGMASGEALEEGKKTTEGQQRRRQLLGAVVGSQVVERLIAQTEATRGVGTDDTIDAIACWTSAALVARGEASSLPAKPVADVDGLLMAIVT